MEFKTIRETAALKILPESRIRQMVARGECPGIQSGNRFLVNVNAFCELLDRKSRRCMEGCNED